jgi:CHRD domain
MKATTKAGALGTALGLGALALMVPTIASGNARTNLGGGKAAAELARPFVASLNGASEVPVTGDTDGEGTAAITINPTTFEVCFDLRASNIATATLAHIHAGAVGVAGPVVVTLTPPTPTSTGCVIAAPTTVATDIIANPAGFYVNVHNADFPGGAIRGQLSVSATTSGDTRLLNNPLRAYDSRTDTAGVINAGQTRVISLARGVDAANVSQIAVPPGAVAAIVKLTVTDTVGAGFLKMYSNAVSEPPTASVNWSAPGSIIGETGPVAVDAEAKVKITAGVNTTHFVIDVVGFIY